jgi:nitrogen-specific signal transduction histidine kinase
MKLSVLKAIFSSMEQGVVFIDDQNRIYYCNPAAEKIRHSNPSISARLKAKPLGNIKGLGIGLSLVQEIVQFHRGKIHIDSEVGRGTTFTVILPKNH